MNADFLFPIGNGVFPTGRLIPLVRAATVSHAPLDDWLDYQSQLGGRDPNEGETRLYPAIAARLKPLLKTDPRLAPLAQARRVAIARNAFLIEDALGAITEIKSSAAAPVVLKGLALQLRAYPMAGMRTSADIDCFVPFARVQGVFDLAHARGWLPRSARADSVQTGRVLAKSAATPLTLNSGVELDVHWHPRPVMAYHPDLANLFYAEAQELQIEGRPVLVPSDTWLLLETLEHGHRRNPVVPIRWMVDAWYLLAAPDAAIDWDRLCTLSHTLRITAMVRRSLQELHTLGAPVPQSVLQRLKAENISLLEQLYVSCMMKKYPSILRSFVLNFSDFFLRNPASMLQKVITFPPHFRDTVMGFDSWGAVGRKIFRRALGKP